MYESNSGTVSAALAATNSPVLTTSLINDILRVSTSATDTTVNIVQVTPDAAGVVTVSAGAEVLMVTTSDTTQTALQVPTNAPVVIFQGHGGVSVDFSTSTVVGGTTDSRIVVGSAGNDHIILDSVNTKLVLGTGNSTVQAGSANDTIVAGLGNSTIVGGTSGGTVVKLEGGDHDYVVTVSSGHASITHVTTATAPAGAQAAPTLGVTTDVTKVQYVALDNGQALILANDAQQAAVSELYQTTFGRTADAAGLKFWFTQAAAGVSLEKIAEAFTHATEFNNTGVSDAAFVNSLYVNTFGRAAEAAGTAFWTDALSHGYTRAQIITNFAEIAAQNIQGTAEHQEANIVGSVTIVHNII